MGEGFGASNTIVTPKDMEAIRAKLREKLGQLNAGIDPEIALLGTKAAVFYIEGGVRKFADYVNAMIADFGESVRPFLKSWYLGAKYYPGVNPDGMDSEADIAAFEAKAKTGTDEIDSTHPGVAIASEVYDRLMNGESVSAKDVSGYAARAGLDEKQGQEWAEAGIVAAAAKIIADNNGDERAAFDELVDLYGRQPTLGIRTLKSKVNQAYSTPAPLAYFAGMAAGLPEAKVIVEPTAGNGMLTIAAGPDAEINANEIDPERRQRLRHVGGPSMSVTDLDASSAEWHEIITSVQPDAIVANPPFGNLYDDHGKKTFPIFAPAGETNGTPSIDLAIALNTLDGLAPNGKAVIIMGAKTGSPNATMGSDASRAHAYRRPLNLDFFKKYNVKDWFTISGELYSKMGASWPIDVVIIDGRTPTPLQSAGGAARPWMTPPRVISTWEELAEMLPGGKLAHDNESSAGGAGGGGTGGGSSGGSGGAGSGGSAPTGTGPSGRDGAGDGNSDGSGHDSELVDSDSGGEPGGPGDSGGESGPTDDDAGTGPGSTEPGTDGVEASDRVDGDEKSNDDEHVVPYVPVSRNGDPGLKAPRNIAEAQRQALLDLEKEVGMEIDDYVASKTGVPVENLRKGLNAAQLDASALAIRNMERGSALINSDQTGVGKGRVVACIIGLYAKARGLVPVFVTAKKNLYSDMIGRDLPSIGITDFKPLITDAEVSYEKADGTVVSRKASQEREFDHVISTGKLSGYDGIFTSYGQLQADAPKGFRESAKEKAARASGFQSKPPGWRWKALKAVAPNAIFILDEAHEAAGNASENFLHFAEALPLAKGVYFSSATYAKRPDNLGLYAVANLIKRAGLNIRKIAEFFAAGGVPLQQALTSMLASAGEFIRREQNWQGVKFEFKKASNDPAREIELADTYTGFLQNLMKLSAQVAKAAKGMADEENMHRPAEEKVNLESVNFGSRLFNVSQQYLLALRSGAIVSETLRLLKEGKKPFIAIHNTMAGPISDLITEGFPVSFNGILLRQMKKLLVLKVREGSKVKEIVLDPSDLPDGGAFYRALEARIAAADFGDMPISPWDYIRSELSKHGVTSAEIAGRDSTLGEDEDGNPALSKKKKAERNDILQAYNDGLTDVLIVNQAGSTGLSAHADPRFKDQRQRAMIVGQPAPDINIFMQMLGRVMRFGQTSVPEYIILQSALAAETRFMTMLRRKLASLNANTTADTESGLTATEDFAPDIFNPVGDEVVTEVMAGSPHILRAIGLPVIAEGADVPDDYARKVTGRLVLLPNEQAEEIWGNIADAFNEKVAYLDSVGQNPLKATALDLDAETIEASVMVDGDGITPFDGDVVVERVKVKAQRKPLTYGEVADQAKALAPDVAKGRVEWLHAGMAMEKATMEALAEDPETTPDMITAVKARFNAARDGVAKIIRDIDNGEVWGIDPNAAEGATVFYGRPIAVRMGTKAQSDFTALSRIRVVLAVNTPQRTLVVPMSKLGKMVVDEVPRHERAGKFNTAADVESFRYIVTGNLLRGFDHVKSARGRGGTAPRIAIYTLKGGGSRVGIIMPGGWSASGDKIVRVKTGAEIAEHLAAGRKIVGDYGIEITRTPRGETAMRMQGAGPAKAIWSPAEFESFWKEMPIERKGYLHGILESDAETLDRLAGYLTRKGVALNAVLAGAAKELKVARPAPAPAPAPSASSAPAPAPAPAPKPAAPKMTQAQVETLLQQVLPPHIAERIRLMAQSNDTVASLTPDGVINLNLTHIESAEGIVDAVEHELLHFVFHDPGLQDAWSKVIAGMDQTTMQRFVDEMTEAGYNRESMPEEAAVRWAHELAKMAKPGLWAQLINAVKAAFQHGLGYAITTLRAQRAAVRLLAAGVNKYGAGISVPQGSTTQHMLYRGGAYRLSKQSRAIEAFVTGSQFPKEMRLAIEGSKIATDALRDSAARVAGDLVAAIEHYAKATNTPIDRANDMARQALQDPTALATISATRWTALTAALTAARNMLDQMSDIIANHVGGPGTTLGQTILDNLGQWTRRSYAIFDRSANWNYDSLEKAADAGDAEKATILDDARAFIQAANPRLSNDEVTSIMREITDERIVSEIILPSGKHVSPNVSSLIRRKNIPAEIRALMGEQHNPVKIFTQSAAWQSQFLARIEHQKAIREIGLRSGVFSQSRGGPNGIYSHQIPDDNRFIELGGLWTTAEFYSALSEMYVDNAHSLVMKAAKLYAYVGGVSKLRKTAENPDGWAVNILGGLVGIVQTGGIFNPAALTSRFWEAAGLVASGRTLKPEHYDAAGAALVYAKRQFLGELSAAGVASSAYSIQDIEGSIDADLQTAIERFDVIDRSAGAVSGALLFQGFGRGGGAVGRAAGAVAGAALGAWKGQAWLTRKEQGIAHWFLGKPDNIFKIMAFLDDYRAHLAGGMSRQAAFDLAVEKARNTMPDYAHLPNPLRQLSKLGTLGSFIAFKFEVYRNSYWNARYAAQEMRAGLAGNPAMFLRGLRRMVGLAAVYGAAPLLGTTLLGMGLGMQGDDEKQHAYRRALTPAWDRFGVLHFTKLDGRTASYFNAGYLVPQTALWELISAGAEGRSIGEGMKNIAEAVGEQFAGGSVYLDPLLEAVTNYREGTSRKISFEEGITGAAERAVYFADRALSPGAADKVARMWRAERGESGPDGRKFALEEEALRLAGVRQGTYSHDRRIEYALREFDGRWHDAYESAKAPLRQGRLGSVAEAVKDANARIKEIAAQYHQWERDIHRIGISQERLEEIRKNARGVRKTFPTLIYDKAEKKIAPVSE